jgi:methionyl-tRNA formyltransferase
MKIVFLGTPEFAVPILEGLYQNYEIALVVSQPNRVKKKGVFIDTPVASKAHELNLKLIQPESIKDSIDEILSIGADTLITAAYGQYLPSKLLNGFKVKVNVHGSLLPYQRGGAPIQRCLMNGDEKTGVTIMEMAKKLDGGKIYSMEEYVIKEEDHSTTLFEKLSIMGKDLLLKTLPDIYDGKNLGIPQDDSLATYSANISPEEEEIHLNRKSLDIFNQVRGLALEPGAYLKVKDIKLKVFKVSILDNKGNEAPGNVLSIKKGITLKTLDGAITLDSVLMPGKKITSGKHFSNGQKIFTLGDVILSE